MKWVVVLLLLAVGGCHAVYFYETEKVSLTVEGRPDPTAPVAGSVGVKERIAAVVPPSREKEAARGGDPRADALGLAKEIGAGRVATGDALSVMSSFRFHKYPAERGSLVSRVTVDAALVTGRAARVVVGEGSVNRVMGALTMGAGGGAVETASWAVISHVYGALGECAREHPGSVAAERRAGLDGVAGDLPATWPVDVYGRVVDAASGKGRLVVVVQRGTPVGDGVGFDRVIGYVGKLRGSGEALRGAAARVEAGDGREDVPGGMGVAELRKLAEQVDSIRAEFEGRVGKEPAVGAAVRTFVELMGVNYGG